MTKSNSGRPTVMNDKVLQKLEEVFALGGTDEEACFYADISTSTLYNYGEENPKFMERKARLKQNPFLKARRTIVDNLDKPNFAFEYMKRKKKGEFSERQEHTGKDGKDLTVNIINYEDENNTAV